MKFYGLRLSDQLFLAYIRNVPNHPFKLRIINWLNDHLLRGVNIKSDNNALLSVSTREFIGWEILRGGSYEPYTLKLCADIMKDGGVCLDIGANMGLFSISLSTNKQARIYAFEPSVQNFQKLLHHITINKAANIIPLNFGLSYTDSFGYLVNHSANNSGTFKVVDKGEPDSYLIRLTTLANVIDFYQISNIRLIKIDVEGFEMNVFNGLFGKSNVRPDNIVMEFSGLMERTGHTIESCYTYFTSLGYKAFNNHGVPYKLGDDIPEANIWWK